MLLEARTTHQTTIEEAKRLAAGLYGLHTEAEALPGEYDDNFRLSASDGRSFVLKVMHPARDLAFVEMQCRALEHLARTAPQLGLPRVVLTSNRESYTQIKSSDDTRLVWALTYVPGHTLATVRPHTPELLEDVGRFLGELDRGLKDFSHPAAVRDLKWDSLGASWIGEHLKEINGAERRALVKSFLERYEADVVPNAPSLRRSVIYGDANDHNVLVSEPWPQPRQVVGLIDFGDTHYGAVIAEAAVAAAYAILHKLEPLPAATAVVRGFHGAYLLEEHELAALYTLIGMRLAVSVTNSANRKKVKPDDTYVTVSEAPAWEALERWANIHPRFAHYTFRDACGLEPVPEAAGKRGALKEIGKAAASIVPHDLRSKPVMVFDLSVGSTFLGADPHEAEAKRLAEKTFRAMREAGVSVGVGRYNEARMLYTSPLFAAGAKATDERRTIHLGIDLCVVPGTEIRAPLDGTVFAFANNKSLLDYGPVVILEHEAANIGRFYTLYGHLTTDTLTGLRVGQRVGKGQAFARVGKTEENGGWAPHVHFQINFDLLDWGTDFPGVGRASQGGVWTSVSPDPNFLLQIPARYFPTAEPSINTTLEERRYLLGKNLSVSYEKPLKIVRGWMQWLYDETGRAYLDFYNNVPLVGHSHPRVVKAAQQQLALLNTNTRYLHDTVNQYAERLTQLLPKLLQVCFFVNSGSEANELALRLARAHTKREDVIVLEHAYHGHTSTLIDVSPYKFDGRGGSGKKPWVHVAPLPDDYRGRYRRGDPQAGHKYAAHVAEILQGLELQDRGAAAFLAETLPSVGGQIVFPDGYLQEAYKHVRAAGAVCIADEVQVGFGRLGTHFWGFETQSVVPDIVVLGKPIGNAFPLAAVITTEEIAASFANGMEFFSTFGGNPVACAVGLAVLDVLREENLQDNAREIGSSLRRGLLELQSRYPLIGDARGSGLFLGVDLVRDQETREPAPKQAAYVVNRLRENGILTGTDGPHHNVLKLRPPLMIGRPDAELFLSTLHDILAEDAAQS